MKKYLIVLSLFLLPLVASAQGFDQDLYYGLQENHGVTELQEFLTDQGHYSGPITGNFFSLTLTAVKQFQVANSISQTGYFGPISRAKATELLSSAGISKDEITTEDGTTAPISIVTPKTTTDVVNSLLDQIKILQQQLATLQQQQTTLEQQNQQIAQQTQTIQQQNEILQQIQQQTATQSPIPAPISVPKSSMAKIEIIVPTASAAYCTNISHSKCESQNKTFVASLQVVDESNYVYLGLVVYDDNGDPIRNVVVTIVATDSSQNKVLNGTGNVTPIYNENGAKIITPYYPFNYEFKTSGDHTITFTTLGMTKSVTLTVGVSNNE